MITTLSYDPTGGGMRPAIVDPDDCIATVLFQEDGGKWGVAYSPYDGHPAPEGLCARIQSLMTKPQRDWGEYCQLLVRHPWSAGVWEKGARGATRRYKLPKDSFEDVMQVAQLKLCRLLKAKVDLLAWLKNPLDRFEYWFRKLVFNLSSAAARQLANSSRRETPKAAQSPTDGFIQEIADYRANDPGTRWDCMVAMLSHYPERTRAVVLLLSDGHTWDEVADTLEITVGEARWAITGHLDELRRDFADFR